MRWPGFLGGIRAGAAADAQLPNGYTVRKTTPFVLDADMLSDIGCARGNNEDCGRIFREFNADSGDRMLVAVADGMGGHNAGEIASSIAIGVIESAYHEMRLEPAGRLKLALESANAAIHKKSTETDETRGMGTTCTALLLQDGFAYSAHVGDSRLYLIRNDAIYLMTEDHSAVMQLVRSGELSLQEARHHPDKNVVTRCLGTQPKVEITAWPKPLPLQLGDHFLLCSDGLYDQVEDDEICAIVSPRKAAEACEELVRLAKERGAPDNVTVAVVGLEPVVGPSRDAARITRQVEVHP